MLAFAAGESDQEDAADCGPQLLDQSSFLGAKPLGGDDRQCDPGEADTTGVRSALRDLDAVAAPFQQSCEARLAAPRPDRRP